MSEPTKAVFLSYAREDTEAARRIAEALRGFGVEVWFDQSELRGGDSWDAKIKKQIRECALFLPLVSAQTQERTEGYFRREWLLAVERTRDMAHGRAFIVPVVIDDTPEAEASVPEEFMRYQWTRLTSGEPTPEFVAQVKRLLDGPKKPTLKAEHARPPTLPPYLKQAAQKTEDRGQKTEDGQAGRKRAIPSWMWGVVGVVLIGVAIGVVLLRQTAPTPPVAASPSEPKPVPANPSPQASGLPARPEPAERTPAADKSIAVLPFTNMSEDKDSGYFADGIHEDILTNLSNIGELRVVSRTSVMQYRATTKPVPQIARELGVAYLLEGSVRRAGNKVRVTGQLIRAGSDQHLWAKSYDRDLTDVFAIQAELAKEIAGALSAALSPQEKARLDHAPTTNPAAYDLVLRARQIDRNGNDTRQELETQEAMLQSAVALDPAYASAWAALGSVNSQMIFNALDTSEARLAKAKAAIDRARQLEPDSLEVLAGIVTYYYYALRDYPTALEQIGRITRQWPKNYFGPFLTGLIQRRQGQWVESLANLRLAAELDPGSAEIARNLMISLGSMRRYPEAIVEQERRVRLLPESLRESFEVARLKYFLNGSSKEGDGLLAGLIAARADPALAAGYRKLWAAMKGDLAAVQALNREYPEAWAPGLGSGGGSPAEYALNNAVVMAAQGDLAGARKRIEKHAAELRARLVNEFRNTVVLAQLAQIEALLGHTAEALAAAQQARAIMPESLDPLSGRGPHQALAFVLAWNGDKEAACAELRQLLATGSQPNVHVLKTGPTFFPLKGYPAFEAILNDPKNNAPLF
ncbi:MAG: TIR domain-containing protein [Opitutae bacterium]